VALIPGQPRFPFGLVDQHGDHIAIRDATIPLTKQAVTVNRNNSQGSKTTRPSKRNQLAEMCELFRQLMVRCLR
jgi:hypothetical protein